MRRKGEERTPERAGLKEKLTVRTRSRKFPIGKFFHRSRPQGRPARDEWGAATLFVGWVGFSNFIVVACNFKFSPFLFPKIFSLVF